MAEEQNRPNHKTVVLLVEGSLYGLCKVPWDHIQPLGHHITKSLILFTRGDPPEDPTGGSTGGSTGGFTRIRAGFEVDLVPRPTSAPGWNLRVPGPQAQNQKEP